MLRYENECVGCQLPCLGSRCSKQNIPVIYCDNYDNEKADYRIKDNDLCEKCAKAFLQEMFDELSIIEKSEILDIKVEYI